MREDVAAVDIGENWLTVARLTADVRGQYRLLHAGLETAREGWDDAGLTRALTRCWRQDRIPTRTVCAGFRSRAISIKGFSFPAMNGAELSSALRLEASELLALDRKDVVWDWRLNPAVRAEGANRSEGILVAAPRRDVEDRIRLLRSAGLYPIRLDVPGLAVSRLIGGSADGPGPEETLAILNLGGAQADLVILSQTGIFPRTIHPDSGGWEDHVDELAEQVVDAVHYAQYGLRLGEISRLYVTGLIDDHEVLSLTLASRTGLNVACWDPVERLQLRLRSRWRSVDRLRQTPTALASCLGLALDTR